MIEKLSKPAAGYIYAAPTDYRCRECWKFDPDGRCAETRAGIKVKPNGYCILWSKGEPMSVEREGIYMLAQIGYGEKPNGTKCKRCKHFDGSNACELVEGIILPDACCDAQEPK